jgi:hypothetical protein
VKNQSYNISSHRYETLDEIARALVAEYSITAGVKYLQGTYKEGDSPDRNPARFLLEFNQWTGSEKLRRDTGWIDKRIIFSEGLGQYRGAYGVFAEMGYKPMSAVTFVK